MLQIKNDFEKYDKNNSANIDIENMDIKDNSSNDLDYYKVVNQLHSAITQLNIDSKKDIANVYGNMQMNQLYGSSSIDMPEDKRMVTIKNPYRLNTNDTLINGVWNITYGGRDLTLNEDNYRWDVMNTKTGLMGYYIIERNLINGDWLNVRWGRIGLGNKEVKELIDKKRLKDKGIIQRDMITAIVAGINTIK